MKLEVGMYVRINGRKATSVKYQNFFMIDKIRRIDDSKSKYKYLIKEDKDGYCYAVSDEMIVKASYNVIDLIEVGDYVDRLRVVDRDENYIVLETFDERIFVYKNEPIKSIVTKEQFKNMEFRVGENND